MDHDANAKRAKSNKAMRQMKKAMDRTKKKFKRKGSGIQIKDILGKYDYKEMYRRLRGEPISNPIGSYSVSEIHAADSKDSDSEDINPKSKDIGESAHDTAYIGLID